MEPADFTIRLAELSRSCFGAAGCNVTFTITGMEYSGTTPISGRNFQLVYQIVGAEHTHTNYAKCTGTSCNFVDGQSDSVTTAADTPISAEVTGVIEQ